MSEQTKTSARIAGPSGRLGPDAARRRDLERDGEQLLAEASRTDPFEKGQTRTNADRLIIAYSWLGDWTNAMTWVERSYANRPGRLRRVLVAVLDLEAFVLKCKGAP